MKLWVSLKPFSRKTKIVYIDKAERLTTAAQNSLLKTLEEPPSRTVIVLRAENESMLLPTIVSRCQTLKNTQEMTKISLLAENFEIKKRDQKAEEFPFNSKSNLIELFAFAEKLSKKDRADILQIVNYWTLDVNQKMIAAHDQKYLTSLQEIWLLKGLLAKNVNARLALERLFLRLWQERKVAPEE